MKKMLPNYYRGKFVNFAFISIFILIYAFRCNAQFSKLFASNNSKWSQVLGYTGPFGAGQLFYSNWVIKGDTIVDGKQLQKIYLAGNIRQMDTNCLQFSKFVYADSNRVYFGDRPSNLKLTYDFNLNVGDSFPINSYFDMGNFNYVPTIYFPKVIESSTIIYLGKSRKKIVFTPVWGTTIVWVEGIGDFNYGLDVPYPTVTLFNTFPTRNEFFCFYDGETVQSNGLCLYNNCNSTRVDDESRKIVDYIIYPNPTCTDQINLMTSIEFDCFRIYDSFGKTIPFNLSKGLDQYNFKFSNISSGIYQLIGVKWNQFMSKEFIVE